MDPKGESDQRNIPHMQLFHFLKQKFPDARDGDVNECIQKFGLERSRCEEELNVKTHRVGYYGPWGRGTSKPSPNQSRVTSPLRPPTPTTPTSVGFAQAMMASAVTSIGVAMVNGIVAEGLSNGSVNCPPKYSSKSNNSQQYNCSANTVNGEDSGLKDTVSHPLSHPISTPVLCSASDLASDSVFDSAQRRQSAETAVDPRSGLFFNVENFENVTRTQADTREVPRISGLSTSTAPGSASNAVASPTCTVDAPCVPIRRSSQTQLGVRHTSSLQLSPMPPHIVHSDPPLPPSIEGETLDSSFSSCNRSYTSVKLQLRQPSSEPQSPIQIRSGGSSLTYSTSSVDHRLGSRSSLQISIGPDGGSISAVRTNLRQCNPEGNSAFRVQYSSGSEPDSAPCVAVYPGGLREDPTWLRSGKESKGRRPQSWYVCDSTRSSSPPFPPQERPRKSSLPDLTDLPGQLSAQLPTSFLLTHFPSCVPSLSEPLQLLHYPPDILPSKNASPEDINDLWDVAYSGDDLSLTKALVQEQAERRDKLHLELRKGTEAKIMLMTDIREMTQDLEKKEELRRRNAEASAKRIEEVQRDNQRLQTDCDQMDMEILRHGGSSELDSNESYHTMTLQLPFVDSSPGSPQFSRNSPVSSLSSGGSGTPQTPVGGSFIPTRPAPPPPPNQQNSLLNHIIMPYQQDHSSGVMEAIGIKWSCSQCTFINHPDMHKCEMCDYPRFVLGGSEIRDGWQVV